jgi:UDP-GlcNAc3NAcA epimerase
MKKIVTVVGARPQFVKAAVLSKAFARQDRIREVLVHTGQHYDQMMSDVFFQELGMKTPDYNLSVGSDTPGIQLGKMFAELEVVFKKEQPDAVLVYGDTNSTFAAAMMAVTQGIPVVHVESGERIYLRRDVPEEYNRIMTDSLASLLLCCTQRATHYLRREGYSEGRFFFVGDPMYDLFVWGKARLDQVTTRNLADYGVQPGAYHLATIHRPQNTASPEILFQILQGLDQADLPVLLPAHPRVKHIIDEHGWQPQKNLILNEPLGYFDFLKALLNCKKVLTDSGGVTREAFFAGKPCGIPMENNWWADIADSGWAQLVEPKAAPVTQLLNEFEPTNDHPPEGIFGDGQAAPKIVKRIDQLLDGEIAADQWHRHGSFIDMPAPSETRFTYRRYATMILQLRDAGYHFAAFPEAKALLQKGSRFVLLRHDVDLCLRKALALANLEAQLGIQATYCFMTQTDHYNLFSDSGSAIVRQIRALGHHLGLHFDPAACADDTDEEELAQTCRRAAKLLEVQFECEVEIVSFQRPNALVLSGNQAISAPFPNTYLKEFTDSIYYVSDSDGMWSDSEPTALDAFKNGEPLQISTHPVWWNEIPVSAYETLQRVVDDKHRNLEISVARNKAIYRVGWLESKF